MSAAGGRRDGRGRAEKGGQWGYQVQRWGQDTVRTSYALDAA